METFLYVEFFTLRIAIAKIGTFFCQFSCAWVFGVKERYLGVLAFSYRVKALGEEYERSLAPTSLFREWSWQFQQISCNLLCNTNPVRSQITLPIRRQEVASSMIVFWCRAQRLIYFDCKYKTMHFDPWINESNNSDPNDSLIVKTTFEYPSNLIPQEMWRTMYCLNYQIYIPYGVGNPNIMLHVTILALFKLVHSPKSFFLLNVIACPKFL